MRDAPLSYAVTLCASMLCASSSVAAQTSPSPGAQAPISTASRSDSTPPAQSALTPPARPAKPQEDSVETYPDVNDLVNHFHFGECEVMGSDGERIKLRQIKDGRMREVALAMLKIEGPSTDAATGKRLFKLSRKN